MQVVGTSMSSKLFVSLIVLAGSKHFRSLIAEHITQVWVYHLQVGVDGLASHFFVKASGLGNLALSCTKMPKFKDVHV